MNRKEKNDLNLSFQCDICKKFFTAKRSVEFHLKKCFFGKFSLNLLHECDICGAQYNYRKSMLRHKRRIHENGNSSSRETFNCNLCKRNFSRIGYLRNHLNKCFVSSKNSSTRLFNCDVCGAEYNYKNSMVRHKRNMHGENGKRSKETFQCDTCEKVYTTRDYFIFHLKKCFFSKGSEVPMIKCDLCPAVFSYKTSMSRHKRKVHENKASSSTEKFQCDSCKRLFTKKDSLKFHLKKCFFAENSSGRLYGCDVCGAEYNYKKSMLRHKHAIHEKVILNPEENLLTNLKYQCSTCGRAFTRKDVLKIHIQKCFFKNTFTSRWFECDICGQQFTAKRSLIHHCLRHQNGTQLDCAECRHSFPKIRIFHTFMTKNDAEISHEHLNFVTKDAVFRWKANLEKSTATRYRKGGVSPGKRDTVYRFICHRSGSYTPKMLNRQREMKFYGSKKVGTCPAQIIVRMNNDTGSCKVLYVKTHLGHNICNKEEELPYIYPKDRHRVLIEPEIVLGAARKKNLLENCPFENQYDLLSERSSSTVPRSAEDFVLKHAKSVIYYKRQFELDNRYPLLLSKDIVIIMMTNSQRERLEKYGRNIIMMDGIHGVDNYDFSVHTLLIVDDYDEWVEVAFAASNRNDELLISIFINCIKEFMGSVETRAFVTDMQDSYYKSWREIMGKPEFRLFCSWQVREAWRRNLRKILNLEKRNRVRNQLYKISSKLNENVFLTELDELLEDKDPDLRDFLAYFSKYYVKNIEAWAFCYRRGTHINSNMCNRAFPSALKKAVRKRNIQGRISLDVCLTELDVYLKFKTREFLRKEIKGKITPKLSTLRKNHKLIENEERVLSVHGSSSEGWSVAVSSKDTNVANVHYICLTREYCENCKLYCRQCNACIHQYECSCMDSSARFNMCIHIHALCIYLRDCNPEIVTYEDIPVESLEEVSVESVKDPLAHFVEISVEQEENSRESLEEIYIKTLDEEKPLELQEEEVLTDSPKEEISEVKFVPPDNPVQKLKENLLMKIDDLSGSLDKEEDLSLLLNTINSWEHKWRRAQEPS